MLTISDNEGRGPDCRKILLVSFYCPTRAHAGGLRILDIYSLLKKRYPEVHLVLYTFKRPCIDGTYDDLPRTFDEIYYAPSERLDLESLQALTGGKDFYDVVDLQFHEAAYALSAFRSVAGKILFTPMESLARAFFVDLRSGFLGIRGKHFLRKCLFNLNRAIEELLFTLRADETICVSSVDASFIGAFVPAKKVTYLETCLSYLEFPEAENLAEMAGAREVPNENSLLYMAYFGSETNVAALKWFLDHVHPVILKEIPDYILYVIGRGDYSPFRGYETSVRLIGEVPSLVPYIRSAKAGLAPALFGAGFRGKINQYALFGLPCVASPLACSGLAYTSGHDILVAEESDAFAHHCMRLLRDEEFNRTVGDRARQTCRNNYLWERRLDAIEKHYLVGSSRSSGYPSTSAASDD